jgi:WD40 repeat protein
MPSTSRLALSLGHASMLRAIARSPDGRLVATGDSVGQVVLHTPAGPRTLRDPDIPPVPPWRADARPRPRRRRRAPLTRPILDLAFVGETLAIDTDAGVLLYDLQTDLQRFVPGVHGPLAADNAELWAWEAPDTLVRLDTATGVRRGVTRLSPAPEASLWLGGGWRPDVRWRRVGQVAEGRLRLWDIDTGMLMVDLPAACDEPHRVALSPDGRFVAYVGVLTVHMATLATGETELVTPCDHGDTRLSWRPDGLYIGDGSLRRWDGSGTERLASGVWAFCDEDPRLYGDSAGRALHLDLLGLPSVGTPAAPPPVASPVLEVTFGEGVLVARHEDGAVRTWSLADGSLHTVFRPPAGAPVALEYGTGRVLTREPDAVRLWDGGELVASWHVPGDLGGWAVGGGRVIGHTEAPAWGMRRLVRCAVGSDTIADVTALTARCVFAAPTGTCAVATDDAVHIYAPDGAIRVLEGTGDVWVGAFSPDAGRLVTSGLDSEVTDWSLGAPYGGEPLAVHGDGVHPAVTETGRVAGAPSYDPRVWLYDPTTRRCRALPGHRGCVRAVAWSPTGALLASGGEDGAVILRNAAGRIHVTLQVLPDGGWIAHTPRGAWVGRGAAGWIVRGGREDARAVRRALGGGKASV